MLDHYENKQTASAGVLAFAVSLLLAAIFAYQFSQQGDAVNRLLR